MKIFIILKVSLNCNFFPSNSVVFEENCGVAAAGSRTKDFPWRNNLPSKKALSGVFFIIKTNLPNRNTQAGVPPSMAPHLNRMHVIVSSRRGCCSFGRPASSHYNGHSVHLLIVQDESSRPFYEDASEGEHRERRLKAGKMLLRSILSESPSSCAAKAHYFVNAKRERTAARKTD